MDPLHLRSLFLSYRSSRSEVLCWKDAHFAKFIGKHHCWSLFINEVAARTSLPLHSGCLYKAVQSESSLIHKMKFFSRLLCSTGFWIYFWYTRKKYCRKKSFLLWYVATFIVKKVWTSIMQNHGIFKKKLWFGWDC